MLSRFVAQKNHRLALYALLGSLVLGTVAKKWAAYRGMLRNANRRKSLLQNYNKKDMVYLFAFPRHGTCVNLSPPVCKVELFLRVAKIPYTVVFTRNIHLSPTRRIPFIIFNGEAIAESQVIIEHLAKHFNVSLKLPPAQQARALAVRRICEISFPMGFFRFAYVDNPEPLTEFLAKSVCLPAYIVKTFFVIPLRQRMITMLNLQGHGDLTHQQYHTEWLADFQALEALVAENGDNGFLMGRDISVHDGAMFAVTSILLYYDELPGCPAIDFLRNSKVLKSYVDRVTRKCFPDLPKMLAAKERVQFFDLK